MFGSNFFGNFGIPDFGYQNADPQGGYLGTNVDPSQNATPGADQPAAGPVGASPQPSIAGSNPLAGGPLAPGGATAQPAGATPGAAQAPPAAGIGSPFGKPGL